MNETLFWIICAAGAFFIFVLLWGLVEFVWDAMFGPAPEPRCYDPTLNAFQQAQSTTCYCGNCSKTPKL